MGLSFSVEWNWMWFKGEDVILKKNTYLLISDEWDAMYKNEYIIEKWFMCFSYS